jgi:hypothetical protein
VRFFLKYIRATAGFKIAEGTFGSFSCLRGLKLLMFGFLDVRRGDISLL